MKQLLAVAIRWGMPGAITVIFLVLPSLVPNNVPYSAWLARLFFVFYLSNPLFGVAIIVDDPSTIMEEVDKYRATDKDMLIFSYIFGHLFITLTTTCLFFYGLTTSYPTIGWWKYLPAVFYGIFISTIDYIVCKMQIRHVKERV